ncbi:MAG: hypothetical protein AAGJ93_06820 [Bacteroidota bacterium]
MLLKKNTKAGESFNQVSKLLHESGQLQFTPQAASELDHSDNPYHIILSELLPQQVEHVAIIEDQ